MPATHRNRLVTAISNTPGGAGDLTIAAAASGYRTFAAADDGLSFDVSIVDGTAWEIRTGCVYTHAGTSLARGTLEDSSTGSAITLTSAAVVTVAMSAGFGNVLENIARNAGYVLAGNSGASQTLTLNAWNRLKGSSESGVFDVQTTDERGWWDATIARFQPTLAGKYLFSFSTVANFSTLGVGSVIAATAIHKNGAALGRGTRSEFYNSTASAGTAGGSYSSLIVQMNGSTDYLEPWIYVGAASGSVVTIASVATAHSLTAIYLGV